MISIANIKQKAFCTLGDAVAVARLHGSNTPDGSRKAVGGMRLGRIGAAEERRVPGRACTHALRELTRRRLFERSERSERSEFGDRPGTRAPQGTRSEAKGKPFEPRPHPTHRLARAEQ